MIEIAEIFALDDEELKERLNKIEGRIITIEPFHDYEYKVIYESNSNT